MELYEVTVVYVKYLRKFEPTKIMSNADGKEQRKFLGVIVQKNGYKYVIPLSSPKYKKDYKIRDYQGENLPEDFSFVAYADRIILLKDTNVPVVYMYEKKESGEIEAYEWVKFYYGKNKGVYILICWVILSELKSRIH